MIRPGSFPAPCSVAWSASDSTAHEFASAAIDAGAAALLVEHPLAVDVPQIVVPRTREAIGPVAAAFSGKPVGADRRDRCHRYQREDHRGHDRCASSRRSASAVIGTLTGSRTTPEAPDLQAQLRAFVDAGFGAVAMEVSSHALALHRVDGTHFRRCRLHELGVDHLDFHQTPERYFDAKARLFEEGFSTEALVNTADVHGRLLRDAATIPMRGFSIDDLTDVRLAGSHSTFTWRGVPVRLPLAGRFNISNALAAAEAVVVLGHSPEDVAAGLATVVARPGRFEIIDQGQPFTVVVDYAHTLRTRSPTSPDDGPGARRPSGRLHVVFGCGGDRDRTKRPQMGSVASELADVVMVTSDNPRSEDPAAIIAAVKSGATAPVLDDLDRRSAIDRVLAGAGDGDVVVVAGKGHETTQTAGSGRVGVRRSSRRVWQWLSGHGWSAT